MWGKCGSGPMGLLGFGSGCEIARPITCIPWGIWNSRICNRDAKAGYGPQRARLGQKIWPSAFSLPTWLSARAKLNILSKSQSLVCLATNLTVSDTPRDTRESVRLSFFFLIRKTKTVLLSRTPANGGTTKTSRRVEARSVSLLQSKSDQPTRFDFCR